MMPSLANAGRSRGDGAHGVRLRMIVLQVLVLSLILTLFGRLWYLQIREGDSYTQAANQNQVRKVVTQAVRGQILDSTGRPLVNNRTSLVVSVSRTDVMRMPDRGKGVLTRLADVLKMPYDEVKARTTLCAKDVPKPCWNGSPYQPIPVTEDATTQMALQIMEHREQFPGVTAEPTAVRQFPAPEGANAAHMLGYLSPVSDDELTAQKKAGKDELQRSDEIGRSGLERTYDEELRGKSGVTQLAVDHLGRVTGVAGKQDPVPGNSLVTSIDARIQKIAEQQLQEALERARGIYDTRTKEKFTGDSGSVVVMDVKTGRIVAMASAPTFDPNVWTGGISAGDYKALSDEKAGVPMISRATQGQFAPGSIFKVITTSAAIEDGYSSKRNYPCTSNITVGGTEFNNLESKGYGDISLQRALEVSCNTVFYGLGYDMWQKDGGINGKNAKEALATMAKAYGLGSKTGIDLPGEVPGRFVDRASQKKDWEANKAAWCRDGKKGGDLGERIAYENCVDGWQLRAGEAVNESIGQGQTLVTPLQMARVYAAIANGGTVYKPSIGKAIVGPDGKLVREIQPEVSGKLPISEDTLEYLQKSLAGVSTNGSAAGVFGAGTWPVDKLPIGAKTGTAQVEGKQSTSWFATMGPVNDPQYSIVMMVSQGGTGSGTSGPSVKKIYEALLGVDDKGKYAPETAMLPHPPAALPKFTPDGAVAQASFTSSEGGLPGGTQSAGPVAVQLAALPPDRVVYRGGRWT